MSRLGHGMGIRLLEEKISYYGEGNETMQEYIKHASIPFISMACEKFHPCQVRCNIR